LKKYFGQGILVLSVSSQLLFGAGELALIQTSIDFSDSDAKAEKIISGSPLGWRLKAKGIDNIFRTVFSSEKHNASNERVQVLEWEEGGKTHQHPLAPMKESMSLLPISKVLGYPINGVWTAKTPPEAERSRLKEIGVKVVAWGLNAFSLDTEASPLIPEDDQVLLSLLFPKAHRELLPAPEMPRSLKDCNGDVVSACAQEGPFSRYLRNANAEETWLIPPSFKPIFNDENGAQRSIYILGLPEYAEYPAKEGYESLGGEAYLVQEGHKMRTIGIKYQNEWYGANSPQWSRMQKIIMATLGTDLTVIQHLLNTHLIIAGTFSAVTFKLDPKHPLRELLHPHSLATLGINTYNLPILLREGAMFDSLYSFPLDTLIQIIQDKADTFKIDQLVPISESFTTNTSQSAQRRIWNIIKNHISEYIDICYPTDDDIAHDAAASQFYTDLKHYIPNNQIAEYAPTFSKASLVDLISLFIYTASVNHDLVGVMTYNYLPWMNHIPSKVKKDGSAPSVGVAKLAANLLLATQPTALLTVINNSFNELVTDPKRRKIVEDLQEALTMLQYTLEDEVQSINLMTVTQPKNHIPSVHS
jgi:hypothetical protein